MTEEVEKEEVKKKRRSSQGPTYRTGYTRREDGRCAYPGCTQRLSIYNSGSCCYKHHRVAVTENARARGVHIAVRDPGMGEYDAVIPELTWGRFRGD